MTTKGLDVIIGEQGGYRMLSTFMRAEDLIKLSRVDYYKSELRAGDPDQGYQRPLLQSRVEKLAAYVTSIKGQGMLPTSVTLSARKPLKVAKIGERAGYLTLSPDPLWVIDGQTRIAGLEYAIDNKGVEELRDFMVPAVIIETGDKAVEIELFRDINRFAVRVRVDLVDELLGHTAQVKAAQGILINKAEVWKLVKSYVIHGLSTSHGSPWFGRIVMPDVSVINGPGSEMAPPVRASSFTSLEVPYKYLQAAGIIRVGDEIEEQADLLEQIVTLFWTAMERVIPEAFADTNKYAVVSGNGIAILHTVLPALLAKLYPQENWTEEGFVRYLRNVPTLNDRETWLRGSGVAGLYNGKHGRNALAGIMVRELETLNLSLEPALVGAAR